MASWNQNFNEFVFKQRVAAALKDIERILEVDRNPRLAEDVKHDYTDKYALANTLTNTALIAQMNVLDRLGLTSDVLQQIDLTKVTTLRFHASDSCKLRKTQVVDVPLPHAMQSSEVTKTTGSFVGNTKKSTVTAVVKRVKEFHWEIETKWEISVYSGTDVSQRVVLDRRAALTILVIQSASQDMPLPSHRDHNPIEVPLTWLFKHIDLEKANVHFTIDNHDKNTKTPCRNQQVEDALTFHIELFNWMKLVHRHFTIQYRRDILNKHNPANPSPPVSESQDLSQLYPEIFIPIVPILEQVEAVEEIEDDKSAEIVAQSGLALSILAKDGDDIAKARVLSSLDTTRLLNEHVRCLEDVQLSLQKGYPDRDLPDLISIAEAKICVLCAHSNRLSEAYAQSIQYIEKMIEDQLVAAIGQRISSKDLDQYMKYHNSKTLDPAPKPFCRAIRRPNHFPDGILSIESDTTDDGKLEPIETHLREVSELPCLHLPLNAATKVQLTGKTYLHGWLNHRFQKTNTQFHLIGRARQFSSFMLVVGTMSGPDRIHPKDAIILQNKDEIKIPLLLNEIPTAKEFEDAIDSLSPEQQRFAKAYRSMQLDCSVLGVCVIQVKPQLEELLGLPQDALTKEMQLTQDLMQLFVEYQVPSDMLSYDGENEEATMRDKVCNVKNHVKAVLSVIEENKKKQLKEQEMMADMATETRHVNFCSDEVEDCFMGTSTKRSQRVVSVRESSAPLGASALTQPTRWAVDVPSRALPVTSALKQPTRCSVDVPSNSGGNDSKRFKNPTESFLSDSHALDFTMFPKEVDNPHALDFTRLPKKLDVAIEKYDKDSSLRSTTIKTSNSWTRERQENLLTRAITSTLGPKDIKSERDKAFDLLDALSRSGSLAIPYSELHVIVCVTHCFEKSVMESVIQDNINPIEKLEWSTLLIASTIHGVAAQSLISNDVDRLRLLDSFPSLLEYGEAEHEDASN